MPQLILIAALSRNGGLGLNNQLLWHLPEDMRHFKQSTLGHTVLMGRRTWESLGRPLPGRRNVVLSRQAGFQAHPDVRMACSMDEAMRGLEGEAQVFVIGGAEIYAAALPLANTLLLSEIDAEAQADAFFPAWPRQDFIEASRQSIQSSKGLSFDIVRYERQATL